MLRADVLQRAGVRCTPVAAGTMNADAGRGRVTKKSQQACSSMIMLIIQERQERVWVEKTGLGICKYGKGSGLGCHSCAPLGT